MFTLDSTASPNRFAVWLCLKKATDSRNSNVLVGSRVPCRIRPKETISFCELTAFSRKSGSWKVYVVNPVGLLTKSRHKTLTWDDINPLKGSLRARKLLWKESTSPQQYTYRIYTFIRHSHPNPNHLCPCCEVKWWKELEERAPNKIAA